MDRVQTVDRKGKTVGLEALDNLDEQSIVARSQPHPERRPEKPLSRSLTNRHMQIGWPSSHTLAASSVTNQAVTSTGEAQRMVRYRYMTSLRPGGGPEGSWL